MYLISKRITGSAPFGRTKPARMNEMETTSAIKTTAADFCNGSVTEDTEILRAAIATGDKLSVELAVEMLSIDAIDALKQINLNAPDDASDLECSDFRDYYAVMVMEILAEFEKD